MANSWKITLCHGTLLGGVETLVGFAQDQGVNIQCVLEVFWDTNASEHQTIIVARYIGAYEGGFDPQTRSWQCDAEHAK